MRDASVIITPDSLVLYRESFKSDSVPFAFYQPYSVDEYGVITFQKEAGINLACDMIRNGFTVGIIH